MSVQFNPSDDFASIADGLGPVTLTRPGGSLTVEIEHALCRALRRAEADESGGRYTTTDVVWHLSAAELPEPPRVGDVLVDAQHERWTLLSVRRVTLGGRWQCVGRNLAVAMGLDDYINLEKATVSKTDAGAEQRAWQPWRSGLRARIQRDTTKLQTDTEQQVLVERYRVYLLDDVEVDATCRVRTGDGTTYRILGSRRAERLGELMYLEVEHEA